MYQQAQSNKELENYIKANISHEIAKELNKVKLYDVCIEKREVIYESQLLILTKKQLEEALDIIKHNINYETAKIVFDLLTNKV